MDVEWQGLDTLQGILKAAPANASRALLDAVWQTMNYVFTLSQIQVPVRFGTLKGSGHLEEDGDEVSIGYGGAASSYALWVHENLSARHKPPTKAKYLEDPMKEAIPRFIDIMGDDRLTAALLGFYPKSPARGQQAEVNADIQRAFGGHRSRATKATSRAPAMTPSQIHEALSRIASGDRRMQRARTT